MKPKEKDKCVLLINLPYFISYTKIAEDIACINLFILNFQKWCMQDKALNNAGNDNTALFNTLIIYPPLSQKQYFKK